MEYIKKCKVCGHVFCYTDKDVKDNTLNAAMGVFSAIGQIGAAIGGTTLDMHMAASNNERVQSKITDFDKCPVCHSVNLEFITREELNKINSASAVKNLSEIKINANASAESLLKRANLFLEDGEWDTASAYCDAVLDMEPENAEAYLGKLLAELKVSKKEKLINQFEPFSDNINYKKVVRFANDNLKNEVLGYINSINIRKENAQLEKLYNEAKTAFNSACSADDFKSAAEKFKLVAGYKDSDELYSKCTEREEEERIKEEERAEIKKAEQEKLVNKRNRNMKIGFSLVVIFAVAMLFLSSNIQANKKSELYEALIGKTVKGTYTYSSKYFVSKETYKIYFVDENYCDIYVVDTTDYKDEDEDDYYHEAEYKNVPYEITGGASSGYEFNWDGPYHSAEPFEIQVNNGKVEMYTPDFDSDTPMTMKG
ncbi:MAG: tetratricopeptide repeat protein [Oscillospiraceae bacterium]|nr:tetratricopeptide repeat protein [Oscillospiraceae bacterium]